MFLIRKLNNVITNACKFSLHRNKPIQSCIINTGNKRILKK